MMCGPGMELRDGIGNEQALAVLSDSRKGWIGGVGVWARLGCITSQINIGISHWPTWLVTIMISRKKKHLGCLMTA